MKQPWLPLLLLLLACASEPSSTLHKEQQQETLRWTPCAQADFDCGRLRVHVDPVDDNSRVIELAVMRHRALWPSSRLGVVFFDRGGPAESLTAFPGLYAALPEPVQVRFDIVTFDRRGTGESEPMLSCPDVEEVLTRLFARSPGEFARDSEDLVATARACDRSAGGGMIGALGSARVAHDVDALRAALGEEEVVFYGASYGTLVGSIYAALFPERVRALVLDGVVPLTPTFHELEDTRTTWISRGKHATIPPEVHRMMVRKIQGLDAMAKSCDDDPRCPARPDSGKRSGRIERRFKSGEFAGFSAEDWRAARDTAVDVGPRAQAEWFAVLGKEEDDVALRAAFATFFDRWVPEEKRPKEKEKKTKKKNDAFFWFIRCTDGLDDELPLDELRAALADNDTVHVPRCQTLPIEAEESPFSVVAPPNVRALVFSPLSDPRTSVDNARIAASALGAPLVTWQGVGHTAMQKSACARDHLVKFVVDGERPVGDVDCPAK